MKTYLVKNPHGQIKQVPENLVNDLLKLPGFKLVGELGNTSEPNEEKNKKVIESGGELVCPVCGFKAKSKLGLIAHMKKHKKSQ